MILQKEEQVWRGFQATEAHIKHLVPTVFLSILVIPSAYLEESPKW